MTASFSDESNICVSSNIFVQCTCVMIYVNVYMQKQILMIMIIIKRGIFELWC